MKPGQLVLKWIELINQGNASELAELYHENAINHQVPNVPVLGKSAIKEQFLNEFHSADMSGIVENIFQDGGWAILEWKDPPGMRGCGFFQVVDSKILYQRGYWDKPSFLRQHHLPIAQD